MIRRLDHIILCVRDREAWAERLGRVLGLRSERSRDDDPWGFANHEFNIGDGFLGVVSPSTPDSQLERFLARHGDAYYAVSVACGSLEIASAQFAASGVHAHVATRDGAPQLLWPRPSETAGVLFQVFGGIDPAPGANPRLAGLRRVVIAARDLEESSDRLRIAFGLRSPTNSVDEDELGAEVATFDLDGSPLGQQVVIACPLGAGALADHLTEHGASIFEWGLVASDLDGEMDRLDGTGIGHDLAAVAGERRLMIDPAEIGGLRLRLHGA